MFLIYVTLKAKASNWNKRKKNWIWGKKKYHESIKGLKRQSESPRSTVSRNRKAWSCYLELHLWAKVITHFRAWKYGRSDLGWEQKGHGWPRMGDLMRDLLRSILGPLSGSTPGNSPESFLRVSQAEREEGCLGARGYKLSHSGLIPSRRRSSHLRETFQEQLTLILYVQYQKTVKEETHTKPFTSQAQPWYGDQIRTLQKTNLSCQHRCKNIKKLRSEVINRRKYMSLPSVLRVGLAWQSQWTTLIT